MKNYLITAFGVIFFSIIVSFIVPKGKTNKIINFVIKLICIIAVIQPLGNLLSGKGYASENLADSEFICNVYSNNQSQQLESLLEEKFNEDCVCEVLIVYDNGEYKVETVKVITDIDDYEINKKIYAYLKELGYINITVNDETY